MADPIISVSGLTVVYGGHRVLDGVSLDIEPGEVMVLLGGSGSGKTTMLRHIIGLERPTSGTVRVRGVDINRCSTKELKAIRRTMGVAFQECALFNSMSIEENVGLPLHELTTLADPVIEIMTYMKLAAVGLGEAGKQMPQELSGGMKKRAAVARATALDPEILVFDEPSAGLDPIVAAGLDELDPALEARFSHDHLGRDARVGERIPHRRPYGHATPGLAHRRGEQGFVPGEHRIRASGSFSIGFPIPLRKARPFRTTFGSWRD